MTDRELAILRRLLSSAKILHQNAQGCAVNHYGHDFDLHGTPGWLIDTEADIKNATALLDGLGECAPPSKDG